MRGESILNMYSGLRAMRREATLRLLCDGYVPNAGYGTDGDLDAAISAVGARIASECEAYDPSSYEAAEGIAASDRSGHLASAMLGGCDGDALLSSMRLHGGGMLGFWLGLDDPAAVVWLAEALGLDPVTRCNAAAFAAMDARMTGMDAASAAKAEVPWRDMALGAAVSIGSAAPYEAKHMSHARPSRSEKMASLAVAKDAASKSANRHASVDTASFMAASSSRTGLIREMLVRR